MTLSVSDNLSTFTEPSWVNPEADKRVEQLPKSQFRSCIVLKSNGEYLFVLRFLALSKPESGVSNAQRAGRKRVMQKWIQLSKVLHSLRNTKWERNTDTHPWFGGMDQKCVAHSSSGFPDIEWIMQKGEQGWTSVQTVFQEYLPTFALFMHCFSRPSILDLPTKLFHKYLPYKQAHNLHSNRKFESGSTTLHAAAQSRQLEQVQMLLDADASIDMLNQEGRSPHQDSFVYAVLGMAPLVFEESQDIEGSMWKRLMQAKKEGCYEEQIICIDQMGELYLRKGEWVQAAKIFNTALAICQKHLGNPNIEKYLFYRLERCESLFLESKGYRVPPESRETIAYFRERLKYTRELHFNRSGVISKVMFDLTTTYKLILATLIDNLMKKVGPPPVEWACIGLGSMARDEMCPYSDIECAILVETDTPEALAYFRTVAKLLEIRMVNLGETEFPIFGTSHPSPTPKGYSLDTGGNTPLGKPGLYELITTPKKLADFQTPYWLEADIVLVNALNTVCWVAGDRKLLDLYAESKTMQLNKKEGLLFGRSFRSQLARKLLEGHLIEFRPELSQSKEDLHAFGIKQELYRPFQSILSSLALYHSIELGNITACINELYQKGVLSPEGAEHLTEALGVVLTFRFNAHKFYQKEEEYLAVQEVNKAADSTLFYIEESQMKALEGVYKVLLLLHKCASDGAFDKDKWKRCSFYDDSLLVCGTALAKALQHKAAQHKYQQAVALNPNDIDALIKLGDTVQELADFKEALRRYRQALELAKRKYGKSHRTVAISYLGVGAIHFELGDRYEALKFYQKALKILELEFRANLPEIASCYNKLGLVYDTLTDTSQALEFFKKAKTFFTRINRENHPTVADCYNNIGSVYASLNDKVRALEFFQKALNIRHRVYGEGHPDVASSYNNIGEALALKDDSKALDYHQKALRIRLQVYGEHHPQVATSYKNMSEIHARFGDFHEARKFSQEALRIRLQVYGEDHYSVAITCNDMGTIYANLRDNGKALEFYQKALKVSLRLHEMDDSMAAICYSNIGETYTSLGDHSRALENHQKALEIDLQLYGESHDQVGDDYSKIGGVYRNLNDYKKALEMHQKALEVFSKSQGSEHPNVAIAYNNIAEVCGHLGDYEKAADLYWKALQIWIKIYGYIHPQIATIYNNLGALCGNVGDNDRALKFHKKALRVRLQVYDGDHPDVVASNRWIAILYERLGNKQKALKHHKKASDMEKNMGISSAS